MYEMASDGPVIVRVSSSFSPMWIGRFQRASKFIVATMLNLSSVVTCVGFSGQDQLGEDGSLDSSRYERLFGPFGWHLPLSRISTT
jgi:hypothetical protein